MNVNDIIKALEWCMTQNRCLGCPLCEEDCTPLRLWGLVSDLITRQNAEIERLQKGCDEAWEEFSKRVEKYDELFDEAVLLIKQGKVDANKEFAEILKKLNPCMRCLPNKNIQDAIDAALKIKETNNKEWADKVKAAIKKNNGYCPCQIEKTEDTKCICKGFREQASGECHCGLYIKGEEE